MTVTDRPLLACVVLAHGDPTQVRRLVEALDPFPVFLHCDRSTSDAVFHAMTTDLPARCQVLGRLSTGWAKWENVEAELAGYRAALQSPASHIAVMTGTDYPVAPTEEINALLAHHPGISFAKYHSLPYEQWGRDGGMARLRYRHWAFRKHMLRLPIPRRIPADLVLAGGSQLKVLARQHAEAVVRVVDENPSMVRYFRRSWVPDETFVGTVLKTRRFGAQWHESHVEDELWFIGWDGSRRKSPPWLTLGHLDDLRAAIRGATGIRPMFARKFSTDRSTELLDAIDAEFRAEVGTQGP